MAVPVAAQISANAFTIVPSDTTIITANGVYVGGAGNVTVRPAEQEGTTATLMVAFGST
jgi:hypothetical protein